MTVVIAFDFGLKRTGVAVGNTITANATPATTLISKDEKQDWEGINELVKVWQPQRFVVGMPTECDGNANPLQKSIERFCNQLRGRYNIEVDLENEQFTSLEAAQRLKQVRQSGRKKKVTKDEVDKLAAAIILENWFRRNQNEPSQ